MSRLRASTFVALLKAKYKKFQILLTTWNKRGLEYWFCNLSGCNAKYINARATGKVVGGSHLLGAFQHLASASHRNHVPVDKDPTVVFPLGTPWIVVKPALPFVRNN